MDVAYKGLNEHPVTFGATIKDLITNKEKPVESYFTAKEDLGSK